MYHDPVTNHIMAVSSIHCHCRLVQIIAITSMVGLGVRIEYLDNSDATQVTSHCFPEDAAPAMVMMYRPGHYDLLYSS